VAYNGCSDLLARVKAEALTEVGRYSSLPSTVPGGADLASGQATAGAAASSAAVAGSVERAAPAGPGATGYSTTNNQEAGADEPDVAKTNGRLMVVIRHQPYGIQVVDVASSRPRLAGFVALPQFESNAELFLVGGYAVAVDQQQSQSQSTHVTVISLADPDHPVVARSFSLDGDEVGARLIEGRVVLVLQSRPRVPLEPGAIRGSTLGDWVPNATTDCGTVFYPTTPSGLGTVSVVSLDPSSDQVGKGATIMGNASVVYASATSVYLATQAWQAQQAAMYSGDARSVSTDIHGFDISDPTKPRYVGSGSVPGTITDQYALSESHGYLRVATTVGQATPPVGERSAQGGAPTFASDNMVTVLQPSAGRLAEVGRVGGLGRGEKIYGVRFVGDLGYVVTFRQTDPLYVLDLSDPHHPQLRGQLELTGFSTYLHPLGGGLLFGIGHGVDQYDRQNGIQLSVFDVSDPANPSLKSRINLPGAFSSADSDHHAFLWWAPSRLVVVPISQYLGSPFAGEVAFKVGSSGSMSEFGRIAQSMVGMSGTGGVASGASGALGMTRPAGPGIAMAGPTVERALVVGDLLYTVSDQEIVASHLDSLREAARLTYQ
jgi:uncharacterized secreted protein with C-terminal beta-propeller domain